MMSALFAVVLTWQSEEPTTQLQESRDTQHVYSVSTRADCSSLLLVVNC